MKDADRFDRWFKSLPLAKQAELRKGGVIPYDEMPIDDNVFPVVEDHKMWSTPIEEDRQESTSFMSEEIVRERLAALLGVLEKFSDRQMRLHLRFIRAMLGTGECETLAKLSKDFGITKQAMTWRARQVRAALGRLAVDASSSQGERPLKESPLPPPIKRVAARPGVKMRVPCKKVAHLASACRKAAKTRKPHGRKA